MAVSASAVTVSSVPFNPPAPGETIFETFAAPVPGVVLSGSYSLQTGSTDSVAAPFGDTTTYFATPATSDGPSGSATIDFSGYLAGRTFRSLSF